MNDEGKPVRDLTRRVQFFGSVPGCATEQQYNLWKEAARQSMPPPKVGFCSDCTPEYQKEMIAQRRCENPDIQFIDDGEGWKEGCFLHEDGATA